jgi:histidinol phosphatase-like enzyme
MIQALMAQAEVADISTVAKIGDTPSDLHEGTNAGCPLVIGVTYGTHTREQLEVHPHTHLVDSVEELRNLLLAHAA